MLTTENTEKKKASSRHLRLRTLVKLALLVGFITVLISVLQILVPAIIYRDDLIALLNYSDDCHAPCFMGITPGVTKRDEARDILEQNPHIKFKIKYDQMGYNSGHISFETDQYGGLSGQMSYHEHIIRAIYFPTNISFTTFLLTYGYPQWQSVGGYIVYPEYGLQITPTEYWSCPDPYDFLWQGTGLTFLAKDRYADLYPFSFPGCPIISSF